MSENKRTIKISPIKNGTVIDHIRCGQSLKVLKILGLTEVDIKDIVSIAINVESSTGKKDIVKVENKEISREELDKISLISPETTINIIRDYGVVNKHRVTLPDHVKGILKCRNPNCITYKNEPVEPEFKVISSNPVNIKCIYCEREMKEKEISENLL